MQNDAFFEWYISYGEFLRPTLCIVNFAASHNPSFGIPEQVVCDIAKENSELDQMRQDLVLLNCFLDLTSASILNWHFFLRIFIISTYRKVFCSLVTDTKFVLLMFLNEYFCLNCRFKFCNCNSVVSNYK